jgi:hypothetical protein
MPPPSRSTQQSRGWYTNPYLRKIKEALNINPASVGSSPKKTSAMNVPTELTLTQATRASPKETIAREWIARGGTGGEWIPTLKTPWTSVEGLDVANLTESITWEGNWEISWRADGALRVEEHIWSESEDEGESESEKSEAELSETETQRVHGLKEQEHEAENDDYRLKPSRILGIGLKMEKSNEDFDNYEEDDDEEHHHESTAMGIDEGQGESRTQDSDGDETGKYMSPVPLASTNSETDDEEDHRDPSFKPNQNPERGRLREASDNHDFERDLVGDDEDEEMPDAREILVRDSRSTRGQTPARSRMLQETFERLNSPEKRSAASKKRRANVQPVASDQHNCRQQKVKLVLKPRERKTKSGRVVKPTEKVRRNA